MIKFVLLTLIRIYQQTGEIRSWLFPPMCRFYPSCSNYAAQAIERHGAIRGSGYAIWRVLRCHPGSRGGVDPIPS